MLTEREFRSRFHPIDPAPQITVDLTTEEWAWLDGFAARTGIASRAAAFAKVMWCGIVHVNQAQRELACQHRAGGGQTERADEPWYFAEAYAALPAAESPARPGTSLELTVDPPLQAKFGQFTDLAELRSPALARRLFLAGRATAVSEAAERRLGPTFASVFPEVETLDDPRQARAVVVAATEAILTHAVTTPDYAAITAFAARGYFLAIVEFTGSPNRWYHPFYCAAADNALAILAFCDAHAEACFEETGLAFQPVR